MGPVPAAAPAMARMPLSPEEHPVEGSAPQAPSDAAAAGADSLPAFLPMSLLDVAAGAAGVPDAGPDAEPPVLPGGDGGGGGPAGTPGAGNPGAGDPAVGAAWGAQAPADGWSSLGVGQTEVLGVDVVLQLHVHLRPPGDASGSALGSPVCAQRACGLVLTVLLHNS